MSIDKKMKINFIHIKLSNKNNINSNKILELFKLSIGNNINDLNYYKNKPLNQNLEIIYYKRYIKENIGKMIYKTTQNKEIKILDKEFISNNKKRAKIFIYNKQYKLKENIEIKKHSLKIEIKFFDNIIFLNSMFSNCKSLSSVHNFKSLKTKNLKTIHNLFAECNSLIYIDDISNWNIKIINNMSKIFYQCSSLYNLPDISKWNISNANNISGMFSGCSSLVEIPDISKWITTNLIDISLLFCGCSK